MRLNTAHSNTAHEGSQAASMTEIMPLGGISRIGSGASALPAALSDASLVSHNSQASNARRKPRQSFVFMNLVVHCDVVFEVC